jgi:hypothetical protein
MRSAGAGLFGALLMVAPLVAIPIFAVVGVPQFAPAVSPASGDPDASADEFDADDTDVGSRSSRKVTARSSRGGAAKRRSADDLYAALPEPLTTSSDEAEIPSARPWNADAAEETGDVDETLVDEPAIARPPRDPSSDERRPARKVWSNNSPRGSLGEWELDEETGAPSGSVPAEEEAPEAELASLGDCGPGRARGPARGEFEPEQDAPEPLNAGAINFLAKNTPDRKPAPRGRVADEPSPRASAPGYGSTRSAPKRGGRPIPSDDVEAELPELTEPVVSSRSGTGRAGGRPAAKSANSSVSDASDTDAFPSSADLGSSSDDEVDTLSEADLQRGFAGDPLGTRSPGSKAPRSKAPVRYASAGSATPLDFPEPTADAFADAEPLSSGRSDAPVDESLKDAEPSVDGGVPDSSIDVDAGATPAVESMTWKQATAQLKAWGIRKYRLEADPETEGFVFVCMAPDPNSTKVTRRFEASGGDPLSAVRTAIGQISEWYSSRTRRE